MNKHERNHKKALERSKRNQANRVKMNARQRRKARRKNLREWNETVGPLPITRGAAEHMTVQTLRDECAVRNIKTTTKMRKPELIDLLVP
jgi:hypothetical protein